MATGALACPFFGGKMKKYVLIILLTLFTVSLFAKDDSTMYWEKEIDNDGQLITYYLFKTDEQLNYNLENFIETLTGINNSYLMPNINTIKKQMVSEEYLEKNYPKIYKSMKSDNSENSKKIDWDDYKYFFYGQSLNNNSGIFFLAKRIEEKIYFSITLYMYGGLNWSYTNQSLDLFEASL